MLNGEMYDQKLWNAKWMIVPVIYLIKADSTGDILMNVMMACSKGKALKCTDYIQSVKPVQKLKANWLLWDDHCT